MQLNTLTLGVMHRPIRFAREIGKLIVLADRCLCVRRVFTVSTYTFSAVEHAIAWIQIVGLRKHEMASHTSSHTHSHAPFSCVQDKQWHIVRDVHLRGMDEGATTLNTSWFVKSTTTHTHTHINQTGITKQTSSTAKTAIPEAADYSVACNWHVRQGKIN